MHRHPRRARWGGAIAGWELTRLARRGSPTVARLLVGLLLFAALFVTYLAEFPRDLSYLDTGRMQTKLSAFGQTFALVFLLVQAAVVLLLTPLFVAGAIVEETERRTLEFLLSTDLDPREIILGKLWPRLLLVVGVVVVGWPVLAITQVWGGVDIQFVVLASVVVLVEIWAVAGISAACAVGAKSLRRALVKSYLLSFVLLTIPVVSCPYVAILALADMNAWLSIPPARLGSMFVGTMLALIIALVSLHLLVQFVFGVWGIRRACFKLRHARYFYARTPWQYRPRPPARWERHPPVPAGSPLLWKELHLGGQTHRLVRMLNMVPWVVWLFLCSVVMVVGVAAAVSSGSRDVYGTVNAMVRWGGIILVGLVCLTVGLHAAGSVARERQQQTLADLLMTPHPRRDILRAKWWGSLAKARGIALGAMAVPLVGVLADGISYWAVVPLLLAACVYAACAASFGLWLSVRSRTVQRATGLWLLLTAVWVGGTLLAAETAYAERDPSYYSRGRRAQTRDAPLVWDRALNPGLAWWQLSFRFHDPNAIWSWNERTANVGQIDRLDEVLPSAGGILLFALLARGFYALAVREFEREGRV
ncbi:MAG TPA: ABC transporter permease subunit [Gemmataceae bacterium]|nr:ABC transporter permease subunit [Gemmataceae bacterium]